ncbi:MAG TPA: hypothetical protein VGU20_15365 [Stellaceae bacterium]|nr:hypothetical protein [Stellaceae bacterium]
MTGVITLREASRQCRALADASDDGLSALSYAQLADEIDGMIDRRDVTVATAPAEMGLSSSSTLAVGGQS